MTPPHTPFVPGQRWTYRTRLGEETSTALILAVDPSDSGKAVSVRLDHLSIPSPQVGRETISGIGHLPIAEEKVRESVLELLETGPAPELDDGYAGWKEAFENGEAGVWTLTLAEIVETVAGMMAQQAEPDRAAQDVFTKSAVKP